MINNINNINFQNKINNSFKQNRMIFKNTYDKVSFTGNQKEERELSILNEHCSSIGREIFRTIKDRKLDTKTAETILNTNCTVPIELLPLSENPLNVGKETVAHMLPMYYPDLTLAKANIYCNFDADKKKKFALLCADMAHEYNHVLQRAQDDTYFGIKNHTTNQQEVTSIVRTCQTIIHDVLTSIAVESNTNKDFMKIMRSKSDLTFEQFENFSSSKIDVKEEMDKTIDKYMDKVQTKIEKEELKKLMKTAIYHLVEQEIEAYNTTIATLEKIDLYDQEYKNRRLASLYMNQMLLSAVEN